LTEEEKQTIESIRERAKQRTEALKYSDPKIQEIKERINRKKMVQQANRFSPIMESVSQKESEGKERYLPFRQ
jgi:hypothetical protein